MDWRTHVYLNGKPLGNHTGGYDAFDFNLTGLLAPTDNELLVHVYDPSDLGPQPRGKQRVAAVDWPGGGSKDSTRTRPPNRDTGTSLSHQPPNF